MTDDTGGMYLRVPACKCREGELASFTLLDSWAILQVKLIQNRLCVQAEEKSVQQEKSEVIEAYVAQ